MSAGRPLALMSTWPGESGSRTLALAEAGFCSAPRRCSSFTASMSSARTAASWVDSSSSPASSQPSSRRCRVTVEVMKVSFVSRCSVLGAGRAEMPLQDAFLDEQEQGVEQVAEQRDGHRADDEVGDFEALLFEHQEVAEAVVAGDHAE